MYGEVKTSVKKIITENSETGKVFVSSPKRVLKYQRNLYSAFLVSVLVPMLLAGTVFLIYYNYNMVKRERRDMRNVLESVSQNIETKFSELIGIGNTFYSQKNIYQEAEALNKPELYQYYDDLIRSHLETDYSETITRLIHTSTQSVRSVVFFPEDSINQYAYYLGRDKSTLSEVVDLTYHEQDWFKEAIENPQTKVFYGPHIPSYLRSKKNGEVYSCVMAIRNVDTKKNIGVVKIDADIGHLKESLNMQENKKGSGLALQKNGDILLRSESLEGIELEEQRYQTESLLMTSQGLELVYYYSKADFYKGFWLIAVFSIGMIALGVGMAFVIYQQRGKQMVEDIRQITDVMKDVEEGNLDARIEIDTQNEIGEIAGIINKMMKNLKRYIEQEYLLVIQNQKAKYLALQSQINPHFLYNTLNGFVALNRMGEKKVLEKSIISLSHLFRYTCTAQEYSDVESELQFLREYLELEKLKYEERLEYIIWMDEGSKGKVIPKLLLQPIVENSITHGMGDTDRSLMINISAVHQTVNGIGEITIISVRDNGCGYDSGAAGDGKVHIGMNNVKTRAELFCKNVIYQASSKPGKGAKTTFVFPNES